MPPAAILDIDGTLVDTNYHHAIAWYRAFRRHQVVLPVWRTPRHVGMGSPPLSPAVAGDEVEGRLGDAVRAAQGEEYAWLMDETAPFEGAAELLRTLKERGHRVVLATSAKPNEVKYYLKLIDASGLADAIITSADVEATKPRPDLVLAAMERAGGERAVMVGDSVWDCEAAGRAGIPTVAILTGGFSEQELRDAGAVAVFESVGALAGHLAETPLENS
jgi:HAD superfamily hydrolase (TIGR01549 family)